MKFKEILLEGAKERYIGMFNDIFDLLEKHRAEDAERAGFQNNNVDETIRAIKNAISEYVREYKNEDWIVWVLRLYRAVLLHGYMGTGERAFRADAEAILRKYYSKTPGLEADMQYIGQRFGYGPTFFSNIKHFLDLSSIIKEIGKYRFGTKGVQEVVTDMEAIESKWQDVIDAEKRKVDEIGDVVLDFGDGFAWYDLHKGGCSDEGRAMQHCGAGSDRSDDDQTILSLRKKIGDRKLVPHVTFVLKRDGTLTEMKGRQNDKPVERYHKYILELMKLPMIESIMGTYSVHKPQNNFMLSDFSKTEARELYAVKPELFNFSDIIECGIMDINDPAFRKILVGLGFELKDDRVVFGGGYSMPLDEFCKNASEIKTKLQGVDMFDADAVLNAVGRVSNADYDNHNEDFDEAEDFEEDE